MPFSAESGPSKRVETPPRHRLDVFPWGDALLDRYAEDHEADSRSIETLREVFYTYLDRALSESKVFRSESGVAYPYTRVSLRDLAEDVFRANDGVGMSGDLVPGEPDPIKREFLMTGFPTTSVTGGPFEFSEMALHNFVALLPRALEDLRAGREVRDYTLYTLGYPTNEFGDLPAAALEEFEKEPLAAIGRWYAELIERELAAIPADRYAEARVALTGVSTGASIAAETGSRLLADAAVTQDAGDLPRLSVAMFAPVGTKDLNAGIERSAQMIGGFVGEGLVQIQMNQGVKVTESLKPAFFAVSREALAAQLPVEMDEEQQRTKRAGLRALGSALLRGTQIPENVKVTQVIGLDDPFIYSSARNEEVRARSKELKLQTGTWGGLQGRVLPRASENARTIAVDNSHFMAPYRESEFARFDGLVAAIQRVRGQ